MVPFERAPSTFETMPRAERLFFLFISSVFANPEGFALFFYFNRIEKTPKKTKEKDPLNPIREMEKAGKPQKTPPRLIRGQYIKYAPMNACVMIVFLGYRGSTKKRERTTTTLGSN